MHQNLSGTAPFVADSTVPPLCWLLARDRLRVWLVRETGALPGVGWLQWVLNTRRSHSQGSETALVEKLTNGLCNTASL